MGMWRRGRGSRERKEVEDIKWDMHSMIEDEYEDYLHNLQLYNIINCW